MKIIKNILPFPQLISGLGWLNIEEVINDQDLTSDGQQVPESLVEPQFDLTFSSVEFNHEFTVSGNTLNYKLRNVTKNILLLNINVDVDVMKSHSGWADQTLWSIKDSVLEQHKNGFVGQEPYSVVKEDLVQQLATSITTKDPFFPLTKFPIKLFVPGANITADQLTIFMSCSDPELGKETNSITGITDITTIIGQAGVPSWPQLIAPITATTSSTTVNVGDDVVVNITSTEPLVKEVYLEPVVGITNKTRVRLTDGQGSYIVKTGDLESGDEIRIKHGYKWFTGVSEFTKTIS